MLRKLSERMHNEEKGFTLIELLVVILIIGILAAIALPAFLGQRAKGQDSEAKSNVRNVVSHMESCYATEQDYTDCTATHSDITGTGITVVNGAPTANSSEVGVSGQDSDSFTLVGASKAGNTFTYTKNGGTVTKSCTGDDGCNSSTW
jgi:type IV pilus assembly protein PilA